MVHRLRDGIGDSIGDSIGDGMRMDITSPGK